MNVILGSASPRRRELIQKLYSQFTVVPAEVDETLPEDIGPEFAPVFLAAMKNEALRDRYPEDLVITADTVVVCDGEIFGKPKDAEDAVRMLKRLSDNTHKVITGCCISYRGKTETFFEETYVTFFPLTQEEIISYVSSGEPMGKAGGYAIQESACLFIERIEGDYYNVVGLPLARLYREIQALTGEVDK